MVSSQKSSTNTESAEQASSNCKADAGEFVPLIDRNRCEAKGDCVRVCPYDVFEIRPISPEQRKSLSLRGKLKAWAHGGQQAALANAEACQACALCVEACPENAITLVRSEGLQS